MDEEYFCEHCKFAGFSQASLKRHTRTEKHKYLSKIADLKNCVDDLQDSLTDAILLYNDLYDAHEELKDEYKRKICSDDEEIILKPS